MSNYKIGAFEALEWTWYMLRNYKNEPGGIDEARQLIKKVLIDLGGGYEYNFKEKTPRTREIK